MRRSDLPELLSLGGFVLLGFCLGALWSDVVLDLADEEPEWRMIAGPTEREACFERGEAVWCTDAGEFISRH